MAGFARAMEIGVVVVAAVVAAVVVVVVIVSVVIDVNGVVVVPVGIPCAVILAAAAVVVVDDDVVVGVVVGEVVVVEVVVVEVVVEVEVEVIVAAVVVGLVDVNPVGFAVCIVAGIAEMLQELHLMGIAFACVEGKTAYLVAALVPSLDRSLLAVIGALVGVDAVVYADHVEAEV